MDVFAHVSSLVSSITGVQLGERQRVMVETRLRRRWIDLGISGAEEYLEYLAQHRESETRELVSLLTTHHSFFFRELAHFDYLEQTALPALIKAAHARSNRTVRIWSAACSRGQEVYSLAMCVRRYLSHHAPEIRFRILGTDVDSQSVAVGANGVFHWNDLKEVPLSYMGDHWARGKGEIASYAKAKPSIKESCEFRTENLLSLSRAAESERFDAIFCRNVFIYFTPEQTQLVANHLISRLEPQGLLFLGLSETLNNLKVAAASVGPSIYVRKGSPIRPAASKPAATRGPKPLRVLCVDDSPTILTLMKKILIPADGFEVVATACHGFDAAEKVKAHFPDVVTLDIHMPEQNGLDYLRMNFGPKHPPVVMVTSVPRESAELALEALRLGASDYIEKPALANLQERAEELRSKLFCAFRAGAHGTVPPLAQEIQNEFARASRLAHPEKALQVIVGHLSDRPKIEALVRSLGPGAPPTAVLLHSPPPGLETLGRDLALSCGRPVSFIDASMPAPRPGAVLLGAASPGLSLLRDRLPGFASSIWLLGETPDSALSNAARWPRAQVLVEDLGPESHRPPGLAKVAADVVPYTSFAFLAAEFFARREGRAAA